LKRKTLVFVLAVGLGVLFAGVALLTFWSGGMTVGLMANVEQALITKVQFVEGAPAGDTIKVTVRNAGAFKVAIMEGYANQAPSTNIVSGQAFVIPKASSLEITVRFPNNTLIFGTQCQLKLITTKGTSLVYSLTYDSTSSSAYDPLVDNIVPTPRPLEASELTPQLKLSSLQAMILCATSVIAAMAAVGACLLANYVLNPRNRKELFALLLFVTLIVVFSIAAVVYQIVFPPQIYF
jgi:hypothetical protein